MIKGLFKQEKFKNDLARFKQIISSIQNPKAKQKGENLLREFVEQATLIDEAHNTINNGYIDPRTVRDNVKNLTTARRRLEQFIKNS